MYERIVTIKRISLERQKKELSADNKTLIYRTFFQLRKTSNIFPKTFASFIMHRDGLHPSIQSGRTLFEKALYNWLFKQNKNFSSSTLGVDNINSNDSCKTRKTTIPHVHQHQLSHHMMIENRSTFIKYNRPRTKPNTQVYKYQNNNKKNNDNNYNNYDYDYNDYNNNDPFLEQKISKSFKSKYQQQKYN